MSLIGVIDIAMKATVGPFIADVGKASKSLNTFVGKAGGSAAGGLNKLGMGLGHAGGQAKGLAGNLLGLDSVTGIVAAGLSALGVASVTSLVGSSLAGIDAVGDLADKLGVSGGALAAFQHAVKLTGGPVEALPEILGKLNGTLGTAARDGGTAAAALKRLGLDAATLAKAGPIEATKAIADGLLGIANPAARASVAVGIFGEQGAKLAGTLKAGSGGIAALEAEAVKLGVALSDVDYAKVAAANDALDRSAAAVTGVGNQLAVGLAPYIDAAATKFTELAISGGGFGPTIVGGLESVTIGIGKAGDVLQGFQVAWKLVASSGVSCFAQILEGLASFDRQIQGSINAIPGVEIAFDSASTDAAASVRALADSMASDLNTALLAPSASDGIKTFFAELRSNADSAAKAIVGTGTAIAGMGDELGDVGGRMKEFTDKLKEQVATFGKTTAEADIYKFAQEGASKADLARATNLAEALKGMEAAKDAQKKLADDAKSFKDFIKTPIDEFAAQSEKFRELLDSKKITPAEFVKGLDKAKADAGIDGKYKAAGAVELGSTGARSAVLANQRGASGDNAKRTADGVDKLYAAQLENNRVLARIADRPAEAMVDV